MWPFQVGAAVGWVGVLWLVLVSPLMAQTLLDQLERRLAEEERAESAAPATGRREDRPSLGISVAAVTEAAVEQDGLPVRQGALVAKVEPSGIAAQHGLQAGDVIVAMNGRRIDTPQDLVSLIKRAQPGQTLELTWYSGRRLMRKSMQLRGEVDPFAIASPPARNASSGDDRARSSPTGPGPTGRSPTGSLLADAESEYRDLGSHGTLPPSSTAANPAARPGTNSGINPPLTESLPRREPSRTASPATPGSLGRPLPAAPFAPDPFGSDAQGLGNLAAPAGRLADRLESSGRPLLGRLGRLMDRVAGEAGGNGELEPSLGRMPGAEPASPPPGSPSRLTPARPVTGPTEIPRANGQPPAAPNAAIPAPASSDNQPITEELQRLEQLIIRLQERIQKLEQRLNVLEQAPVRTE